MRRDLAALGGGLVLLGAGLTLLPGLGETLSAVVTPPVLAALGLAVALTGVAATAGQAGADPDPTPEPAASEDVLGAEFDAALARLEAMSSVELRRAETPRTVRDRLREAAVALVVSREGVDRRTAAAWVDQGRWTDDPVAAAFLAEDGRVPARVRWRERLSTTPRVVTRARRTAEALEGAL